MRNVVLYQLLSLDGVAEEPGDWMFDTDRAIFDNLGAIIEKQDAILLGRTTYDYWVGYWPTSDLEPFATFVNTTQKHVFTSSTLDQEWANTTVAQASPEAYVADLKRQPGGDIGIHGSIQLARTLLRAGLVNELRLVVAPALASGGKRLFEEGEGLQRLELVDSDRTTDGALLLGYRVPSAG